MNASQSHDAPEILRAHGWDHVFADRFAPFAEQGYQPARVIIEYQHIYRVVTEGGELLATVSGRLRHRAGARLAGHWRLGAF